MMSASQLKKECILFKVTKVNCWTKNNSLSKIKRHQEKAKGSVHPISHLRVSIDTI